MDNGPLILPCLYHHMSDDDDDSDNKKPNDDIRSGKVSRKCEAEIKETMLVRAKSIDMLPEVQDACYVDLAKFCSRNNQIERGEELRCLQRNMRQLERDCRDAVSKYSVSESKDLRLDHVLKRACQPIMDEYCADKKEDKGDLLECLIRQKNNPKIEEKCRLGIEHHQLLNIQNVDFNYKFKRACTKEITEHCTASKSKIEVVRFVR